MGKFMHKVVFDYTKKSVNYCVTCKAKGIKKEIIVNQYSTSDICNDCKPVKKVLVDNEQIPYDELISPTLTGWGDKTIQMHYMDANIFRNEAISLLVELRIISGVNYRKYKKLSNSVSNEFMYINKLIDEFKEKHKVKKTLNQ